MLGDGEWHRVGTYDGQEINLYVDGDLIGTKPIVGSYIIRVGSREYWFLRNGSYERRFFMGVSKIFVFSDLGCLRWN